MIDHMAVGSSGAQVSVRQQMMNHWEVVFVFAHRSSLKLRVLCAGICKDCPVLNKTSAISISSSIGGNGGDIWPLGSWDRFRFKSDRVVCKWYFCWMAYLKTKVCALLTYTYVICILSCEDINPFPQIKRVRFTGRTMVKTTSRNSGTHRERERESEPGTWTAEYWESYRFDMSVEGYVCWFHRAWKGAKLGNWIELNNLMKFLQPITTLNTILVWVWITHSVCINNVWSDSCVFLSDDKKLFIIFAYANIGHSLSRLVNFQELLRNTFPVGLDTQCAA